MTKNLLLACCFFITLSSFTQNITKTILVDGLQRTYILHLPPAYKDKGEQKLPVIFALHGGGGTAKSAVNIYNLESLADKNSFIIVYPDAVNKAWHIPDMASRVKDYDQPVDDVHFISVLLDTLIAHYKAYDKQIFCTGISRGAMFSYYLADTLSTHITAIAAVCGGISKAMAATYSFKKPISVLVINGTADPLVNYTGGYGKLNHRNKGNEDADLLPTEDLVKKIVLLNNCNVKPEIIKLPDTNTFDECTETEYKYNCGNVKVNFIRIENGGHTWAGSTQYLPKFIIGRLCKDFSASQKIFDFFMNK